MVRIKGALHERTFTSTSIILHLSHSLKRFKFLLSSFELFLSPQHPGESRPEQLGDGVRPALVELVFLDVVDPVDGRVADVEAVSLLRGREVLRDHPPGLLVREAEVAEAVEDAALGLEAVQDGEDVHVVHVVVESVDEEGRVRGLRAEEKVDA